MAIGALVRLFFNLRHRGLNVWPILGIAAAGISSRSPLSCVEVEVGSRACWRSSLQAHAVRRSLGGGGGTENGRRVQGEPPARRPDHSLPLERRVELDPWGDRDFGIGPENATAYPHPGRLALYPGGQSETELLFPYGYCSFASKAGHLWANHFATLVEGQDSVTKSGPPDALGRRPDDLVPRALGGAAPRGPGRRGRRRSKGT